MNEVMNEREGGRSKRGRKCEIVNEREGGVREEGSE